MPKQNSPLLIPHTKLPTRHSLTSMRNLSLDKKKQMLEPFKRRELEFSTWLRVTSNSSLELLSRWIKELIIFKPYWKNTQMELWEHQKMELICTQSTTVMIIQDSLHAVSHLWMMNAWRNISATLIQDAQIKMVTWTIYLIHKIH
jgi:hypothetical protein